MRVIVGGQLLPEPGGTIERWSVAALAWMIRNVNYADAAG